MPRGEELRGLPQVPLAKDSGGISPPLEQLRQGHFLIRQAHFTPWRQGTVNANPVGITPREQRRPGGGTNRLRHMEIPKDRPFVRHPVQIRSLKSLGAEFSHVGVTLIIRQDDDDVGRCRRCRPRVSCLLGGRAESEEKKGDR